MHWRFKLPAALSMAGDADTAQNHLLRTEALQRACLVVCAVDVVLRGCGRPTVARTLARTVLLFLLGREVLAKEEFEGRQHDAGRRVVGGGRDHVDGAGIAPDLPPPELCAHRQRALHGRLMLPLQTAAAWRGCAAGGSGACMGRGWLWSMHVPRVALEHACAMGGSAV
jgi:hypothetical protein